MAAKHFGRKRRPTPGLDAFLVGRRQAPFWLEKPHPHRPDAVVVLGTPDFRVVSADIIEPDKPAADVAEWLLQSIAKERPGSAKVPFIVEGDALADEIVARVGRERVTTEPLPELDAVFDELAEASGKAGARRVIHPHDVDAELMKRFFRAAARLHRVAPWEFSSDSQVMKLDAPGVGFEGACVAILGGAELAHAIMVFPSLVQYLMFLELAGDGVPTTTGVQIFAVSYDAAKDLPDGKKLLRRAREEGWELVSRNAFPWIQKTEADGVLGRPVDEDYDRAIVCLEAVERFTKRHRDAFEEGLDREIEESFTLEGIDEAPLPVSVAAPYPDQPWLWGEEEAGDGLRRIGAEEVRDLFRQDRQEAGVGKADLETLDQSVAEMLWFVWGSQTAPPDWNEADIEEFLLDVYPFRYGTWDEDPDAVPGHLDAFFEWLGRAGRAPRVTVEAIRRRIDEVAGKFRKRARDPRLFGPEKTVGREMREAGVDPSDEEAVAEFVRDFRRRVEEDPSILPLPGRRRSRAKAFVWDPTAGGPPPDPKRACPCGSGRRYKKCCMPR